MAKEELETFLTEGVPEAAAATVVEEVPAQPTGAIEAEAKAAEPDGAKRPETEDDDGASPALPLEGEDIVPKRAYEAERRRRQDWKERAARAEAERDTLRRQVEEAQRAVPAAQPQPQYVPPPPPIDIVNNPQGFVQQVQQVFLHERTQNEQRVLNERLNWSELVLRDKVGPDKVDQYVNDFKQFAQNDPSLFPKLYQQVNPYGWLQIEVERQRARREIGDDPEAFRARVRAEIEAERSNGAVPRAVPRMAPSLANARSVAGRSDGGFSGPPSLDDILASRGKN